MSETPAGTGIDRRALAIRLGLSLVLGGGFIWALRPYLDAVPDSFDIAVWTIPAFLAVMVAYNVTRTWRWLFLLQPLGRVPFATGLKVGMAGAMWIALLPFRLGELARPLMLAKTTDITMRRALGTIAIERVVDGLTVCGLFFATSSGIQGEGLTELKTATTAVMALFAAALVTLALMGRFPAASRRIVDATLGRVAPKLAPFVGQTAESVSEGLAALPRGGPLLGFLVMSAIYWCTNALGMWVLARGCGLQLDYAGAITLMSVVNITLLVPGGPAQVGVFQAGVVLGLSLFIAPADLEAAGSTYVFLLYVCQLGSIVAAGVWGQRSLSLDTATILSRTPPPPAPDAEA